MDVRHRVYYLVNLNQNHKLAGWLARGWDSYGIVYNKNVYALKRTISSLKVMPVNVFNNEYGGSYQLKVSCKKEEENLLIDLLNKLRLVDYSKLA
jgi:hypothetical protein